MNIFRSIVQTGIFDIFCPNEYTADFLSLEGKLEPPILRTGDLILACSEVKALEIGLKASSMILYIFVLNFHDYSEAYGIFEQFEQHRIKDLTQSNSLRKKGKNRKANMASPTSLKTSEMTKK